MNNSAKRWQNICIIKGYWGLDRDLLNETIGYKGCEYDDYTDEELEQFILVCESLDDSDVG